MPSARPHLLLSCRGSRAIVSRSIQLSGGLRQGCGRALVPPLAAQARAQDQPKAPAPQDLWGAYRVLQQPCTLTVLLLCNLTCYWVIGLGPSLLEQPSHVEESKSHPSPNCRTLCRHADYPGSCVSTIQLDSFKVFHRQSFGHRNHRTFVVVLYDPASRACRKAEYEVGGWGWGWAAGTTAHRQLIGRRGWRRGRRTSGHA